MTPAAMTVGPSAEIARTRTVRTTSAGRECTYGGCIVSSRSSATAGRPRTLAWARGSGGERRRTRLERDAEAASRRAVVFGARVDRADAECCGEDAVDALEGALRVRLDVVEPARDAPQRGDRDGEHCE